MKLLNALNKKLELITLIEENEGEITELQENQLEIIEKEISDNALNIAWYRTKIKEDTEKAKTMLKAFIKSQDKKLESLDSYLKMFIPIGEKLGESLGWVAHRERKSQSIVVKNFDECALIHKDALIINTEDNKRTITIDKSILKTKEPDGTFEIIENKSNYIDARLKS